MSDRIEITINATLPEKGKHGILADAETQADALAVALSAAHGIAFTASTKAVRPGKKSAQAILDAARPAMMADAAAAETPAHPRRHAAE